MLEQGGVVRVNCPCPEQIELNRAKIQTVNSQVQYLLQFYQQNLQIMTKPFTGFLWMGCDLEVLWVEVKQILHLKVSCSDSGPVRVRGTLPYLSLINTKPCNGDLWWRYRVCSSGMYRKWPNLEQCRNSNIRLSTAISASALLKEPHNHAWTIDRNPVNGLMLILGFYG